MYFQEKLEKECEYVEHVSLHMYYFTFRFIDIESGFQSFGTKQVFVYIHVDFVFVHIEYFVNIHNLGIKLEENRGSYGEKRLGTIFRRSRAMFYTIKQLQ